MLKIATGMFINNSFKVKQNYMDKTKKYLNSAMEKVDFKGNPEYQRQHINSWVESQTNGKIKDLFPGGKLLMYASVEYNTFIMFFFLFYCVLK